MTASHSRRKVLRTGGALALLSLAAWPAARAAAETVVPAEVQTSLGAARLQGQGRLRYLGLSVYDIRLWVLPDFRADGFDAQRFALEIEYARALDGERIAERSLVEMRRVGDVPEAQGARWLEAMRSAFPDVRAGDRITGLHEPDRGARFWLNGQPRAEIADPQFARLFFGIWLSPRTSEPSLRSALLGERGRS